MTRILIIEDNYSSSLEFGTSIAQILDVEGYKITLISNIAVGLNLAVNLKFDLIIFELNFYSLKREELLKQIKSSLRNLHALSLLVTANYEFEAVSLIKELGISNYLIAPFTKHDLLAVVTSCFLTI